jgi:hypothetical protein
MPAGGNTADSTLNLRAVPSQCEIATAAHTENLDAEQVAGELRT